MAKFTQLSSRFGLIEYPVTLTEMRQIVNEFPKTERSFYELAFKSLEKTMKKDEKILMFEMADTKLKNGFIVIGERNLYLVALKGGLFAGADTEVLKYKDIKNVDFDIAPNLFGMAQMELGIIYLEMKGLIGSKKRTLRNIPEYKLNSVVTILRERLANKK